MRTAITPKQKLFETAGRLFYQYGYRAVGVDMIAAQSRIGKMTLYRHYPSKDDLIIAFLEQSDQDFWEYFEQSIRNEPAARGKLVAFFQSLQGYTTSPVCYGCPFINFATEYPSLSHPGHKIALANKQAVRSRFHQLAFEAAAYQPDHLADSLLLLMDGAYIAARMYGATPENPAFHVAETARRLIDASIEPLN